MRLALLVLALFQTATTPSPTVPAVNPTLTVWFANRTTPCYWTPATVPATGRVAVSITDSGNVSAKGEIDAMPRGNRQLTVWYIPKTTACPTVDSVTPTTN